MGRNFLKQIPSLLDCPHSRQISTSCRHWFKSRRRSRSVLIRVRQYVGVRINSPARYIRASPRSSGSFVFPCHRQGERCRRKSPFLGRMFSVRSICLSSFSSSSPSSELPSRSLKGRSVKSLLYFPLLPSGEDQPGWPLSRSARSVDPEGLGCEKVDYARDAACIFACKPARDHFERYCECPSRHDLLICTRIRSSLSYVSHPLREEISFFFFIIISILLDYNDTFYYRTYYFINVLLHYIFFFYVLDFVILVSMTSLQKSLPSKTDYRLPLASHAKNSR